MKRAYWLSVLMAIPLLTLGNVSFWDDDDDDFFKFWKRKPGIAPVTNEVYKEECGSCHFAMTVPFVHSLYSFLNSASFSGYCSTTLFIS